MDDTPCYFYSDHHKDFDPFLQQKSQAFFTSETAMKTLAGYVAKILEPDEKKDTRSDFETLLEVIKIYLPFFSDSLFLHFPVVVAILGNKCWIFIK